ncbi:hypothetical protein EVAR_84401_1 [Eumeta japonica]|uniref:Uncharacterized protein n=1 Tax=Eumeta variegata TaxID=151549 RepID=A0A4C1YI82_EUMVA|nr:hypothetical protein EVAR_84401_1 [Eumeta japonica]
MVQRRLSATCVITEHETDRWPSNLFFYYKSLSNHLNIDSRGFTNIEPPIILLFPRTFHANQAHPQENKDGHIHKGVKSVKTMHAYTPNHFP